MKKLLFAVSALSGCLAAPSAAFAQQDSEEPAGAEDAGEEIVVTAAKTGEDLRDVSGAVTALIGEALQQIGAQSAEDYLTRTPGVVFNSQQPGFSTITIRGVNTTTSFGTLSQGTTGSYINDIPLTDPFFSAGTPDIDTFDVDNIQVYRGPQGTLFGSASLGGAVNYVANRPDLDELQAAAEMSQALTGHSGGGLDSAYKLMLNAPLVDDRLAVRAVGIYRETEGYIDNLGTGVQNANDSRVVGGRLLATWRPSERTTLSWLSLYQKTKTDDAPFQNADLPPLTKSTGIAELSRASVLVHNLRLDQDFGFGTLTALVGYHRKRGYQAVDLDRFSLFGFDTPWLYDDIHTSGYSAEVRLASSPGRSLQWLIGGFYDRTKENIAELAFSKNSGDVADALLGPGSGATDGELWGSTVNRFRGKEMALFGEASYEFLDRLKLTLGGRLFKTETLSKTEGFGLLYAVFVNGQIISLPPAVRQEEDGFNPKAALSLELSDDARIYVLASKGFRFGGGNVNPDPSLPATYGSDSLWNYEAGLKSEWLDGNLRFDLSGFIIDWTDIQLSVNTAQGTTGTVNAGDAEVKGFEAELGFRAGRGLSVNSSITYIDAKLTSVNPGPGLAFSVVPGSRLPGASDWLISNLVRYEFQTKRRPFLLFSHRYTSEAPALLQQFAAPGRNPTVGGYHLFDVRAGVTFGQMSLTAFINNVGDKRGVASASYLNPPLANEIRQYVIRSRTFGLTVNWVM